MPADDIQLIIWLYRGIWIGVAMLWLMTALWVLVDGSRRLHQWWSRVAWTLAALLLPGVGLILYAFFRPGETTAQRRELALFEELHRARQREERCPTCHGAIEPNFVTCPSCGERLRKRCTGCGEALELEWLLCPYCEEREPVSKPVKKARSRKSRTRAA